jgi:hypothetical protein
MVKCNKIKVFGISGKIILSSFQICATLDSFIKYCFIKFKF